MSLFSVFFWKPNNVQVHYFSSLYANRVGWWISEVCAYAYQVILKHLYIETTVQKDFAQNLIFWKINLKPKIPYLRN